LKTFSIFEVQTDANVDCTFPFTYNNQKFTTCTTKFNNQYRPQCAIKSAVGNRTYLANCIGRLEFERCFLPFYLLEKIHLLTQVPTDAVIKYVTTVQSGGWWQNGVSINGETLLFIYGLSTGGAKLTVPLYSASDF
jgi:hypothetical protein